MQTDKYRTYKQIQSKQTNVLERFWRREDVLSHAPTRVCGYRTLKNIYVYIYVCIINFLPPCYLPTAFLSPSYHLPTTFLPPSYHLPTTFLPPTHVPISSRKHSKIKSDRLLPFDTPPEPLLHCFEGCCRPIVVCDNFRFDGSIFKKYLASSIFNQILIDFSC